MSKHTPGPWNYDAGYIDTHVDGDYIILAELHSTFGPDDYGVDQWRLEDDEYDANGRLIVAAPEMYELLREVSQAYDYEKSTGELASTLYDLRCMAIRLLAKIEGGGK